MAIFFTIIIVCWVVFGLYWIISSFSQKQAAEEPKWTFINLLAQFLFAAPFVLLVRPEWFHSSMILVGENSFVGSLGVGICALGLAICIWARNALSGNWSKSIDLKQGHELVQEGPYKLVRHPIYTGFILMFLGAALARGMLGGFIGFATLIIGCILRIRQEEALMVSHFKGKYLDYKKRTRFLIPYVV